MIKALISIGICLTFVLFFNCKKSSTGGEATLVVFPKHHLKAIKGATIYVKYKAVDLPSDPTNNYDIKIEGELNEDHVHVKGLRYGKYYLYTVGFDSTIMQTVIGGLPLHIKWQDRKKEIDTEMAVSEQQ